MPQSARDKNGASQGKNRLRQAWFVLGIILFLYIVTRTGWSNLTADFARMKWYLLVILAFSGVRHAVSALAWKLAFLRNENQSVQRLFGYRLVGDALNYLSVAGPFLGEPVKASLLEGIPFVPALASTLVLAFANSVAATLVVVAGLVMLLVRYVHNVTVETAGIITIAVFAALGLIFSYLFTHRRGFAAGLWRFLQRTPLASVPKVQPNLELMEQRFASLHEEKPLALVLMFALSMAAQVLGLLEIYAVVIPLNIMPGLATIVIVEALTKTAKALFFFIPARVGADEGSSIGVFKLLEISAGAGLTLAIARRFRALFWSFVGLGLLFIYNLKVKPKLEVEPEI